MLLFPNSNARASTEALCEPCSFKALWFSDSILLAPKSNERDDLLLMLRWLYAAAARLRQYLFDLIEAKLYFLLSLYIHVHSLLNIMLCMWSKSTTNQTMLKEASGLSGVKPDLALTSSSRTINRLPVEIRLKILENLITEETIVKAVGYSDGARNLFLVKERGYCPLSVMLTCNQLYLDMQDVYFRSVTVTFKAAFPSAFDGDMACFASDYFRNNVRTVRISDPNLQRRAKIASAFRRARIEFYDKGTTGSRKGAYYFT